MKSKYCKNLIVGAITTLTFVLGSCTYGKTVPRNLEIRFTNASNEKVHALFIDARSFSKVFEAGGWTKKSFDALKKLSMKCAALFPEKEKKKSDEEKKDTEKKLKVPTQEAIEPWLSATLGTIDKIIGIVTQPDVILTSIKKKDYFEQVFPTLIFDSYKNATRDQKNSNLTSYSRGGDLVLAIYPDDNYGLPNFGAPLYIGDFNHSKYNAAIYGPMHGSVLYQYINPITGKVTKSKDKLFVPVEVTSEGKLKIQNSGQDAAHKLAEKEEEVGGLLFE